MANAYNDYGREIVVAHEYGWYKVPGATSGMWLPKVVDADGHQQIDVQAMPGGGVILGTVGIDQTTPGTTNGVVVNTEPSGDGTITTMTHTAPTAGVATGALLAANANRLYALIINDSDTVVYIKIGAAAVLNQGIRINPSGGSYEMSKKDGNLSAAAINGISGVAGKVVLVTEGV